MTPLQVRIRPDLVIEPQGRDPDRYWIVQDPVALSYFRLREEEYSILRMLDGRATLEDIRVQFERLFAPLRLSTQQLHGFLFRLHELGLIVADVPGQGAVLHNRRTSTRRKALLGTIANPLAIRLPGVPAGRLVNWLYPRCKWIFSPVALAAWTLLVLSASTLIVVQFGALQARLPSFGEFFNIQTASWFAVALIGVKVLHELGHALVCRHFGGQCREIGVLLLAFTPAMYCDVSDAWRIESKWRRMLVSAGGMLVELVLASIAAILWLFSEPGLLNAMCLRIVFLSSVSTLLFNGNPLLRADGYYILSDLVGVPNLWAESRGELKRTASNWLLGTNLPKDPTLPHRLRWPLLGYALASIVYGWLLVVAILWFLFKVLEPQGLAPLAWCLAFVVLGGMIVPPIVGTIRRFGRPGRWPKMRRGRTATTLTIGLAILAGALLVPLPHRIGAPMWLEVDGAASVYVSVAGTLQESAVPGSRVAAGQPVAKLSSPEIELQLAELSGQVAVAGLRLDQLRLLATDDPTAGPQIPAAEKSLDNAREQLAQWQQDRDRLTLVAPCEGTVIPLPAAAPLPADSKRLAGWQRTPLESSNRGALLEVGTLVCLVGDPGRLEPILVIDETDVAFVRPGQQVRLWVEQGPVFTLTGRIGELAKADADDLPHKLARVLDLPLDPVQGEGSPTLHTYYQARVELDPHSAPLLVGMHGRAKILADWQPLGQRLWRYLQRTFGLA